MNSTSSKNKTVAKPTTSIMLPFDRSEIVTQYGYTCKLTAIASMDRFFAKKYGFKPIPVFKNSNSFYGKTKHHVSIRQLAKTLGSVQGELLEIGQLEQLLNDQLGYTSETITISNEKHFRKIILKELKKGQPCISFFAVHRMYDDKYGHPITLMSDNEQIEHACLITGYDPAKDILRITHWGEHFYVSFTDFYQSNQYLEDTRHQEFYFSLKQLFQDKCDKSVKNLFLQYKYYSTNKESTMDLADLLANTNYLEMDRDSILTMIENLQNKASIIPQENTGFRGKLICIAPLSIEQRNNMHHSELRANPKKTSHCSIM